MLVFPASGSGFAPCEEIVMRFALTVLCLLGLLAAAPGPASAAPLALGDHATQSRQAAELTVDVAWKRNYKKAAKRSQRRGTNWASTPYFRPYYYYHWQQYYPYGGPLF
jgi:hypothetical protein